MADVRELADLIEQFAGADGAHATAFRDFLHRSSHTALPLHAVYEPAVCFVAQGRKQVMAGEFLYDYDGGDYLIISVDVPIVGHILEASPQRPFYYAPRTRSGRDRRTHA